MGGKIQTGWEEGRRGHTIMSYTSLLRVKGHSKLLSVKSSTSRHPWQLGTVSIA